LSGLEDLEKLDVRFKEFRNTLYSLTSKQFERSVHTVEVNTKIDEEIERFLVLISPYFTLRSSQKALEWLVNRYHIQQFNIDAFVMCVLPFHDTKIFVRVIQLVSLKNKFSKWNWLYPLQKPGIPLPKKTLLNCCAKELGLTKLICANLEKALKIHSEKPSVLNIFIAFFTTTMIGMVEQSNGISEEQLAILLPSLLSGLVSKFPDLIAGCYMIIAQLNRKANLNQRVIEDLAFSTIKV
jgi:U3 small nucleolar RNA-associated protein 10